MSPLSAPANRSSAWRRLASSLALVSSLGFAFQPTLLLAQTPEFESVPSETPSKAKAPAKTATAKKVSRRAANDTASDELNQRESQRIAQLTREAAGQPAAEVPKPVLVAEAKPVASEPPTVAAIPPRSPIVTASLTPEIEAKQTIPAASPPSRPPAVDADVGKTAPSPRTAQVQPPAPTQAPVPIQPPGPGTSAPRQTPPVATGGAPSKPFGQGQVVPTEQPTLTLEIHKGTAIKLPGAATTVFVASPDIADVQVKSPTMIYVFAKKPGETVLYAVDDQDRVLLNTIVNVTSPISRIKAALDALHPGNGVTFDNQGESIVLGGVVRSAAVAEEARRLALQNLAATGRVINNIKVDAPTQVQLRVKIAEVQRNALKRVGINWQNINGFALTPFLSSTVSAGAAVQTIQSTGGVASGLVRFQGGNADALLDFLATQNQATILAEPNLVAMSGETASFLAGGEIPLIAPQSSASGSAFTITYKQVGVSLSFTPTIIGDRINLKVAPEVSQISSTGSISVPLTATAVVSVPALSTRKASTTLELGSGQSFAMAGLLQQTSQQDITKLPWLGDIPILGSLFKSDAYQRAETELVIIVTPYFVEPTSGRLRTPLSGRVPPTDADRILYQRTSNPTPPQRTTVGREQFAGPGAGFKLD